MPSKRQGVGVKCRLKCRQLFVCSASVGGECFLGWVEDLLVEDAQVFVVVEFLEYFDFFLIVDVIVDVCLGGADVFVSEDDL